MSDRTVRRLTTLEHSASTARLLNLLSVHRKLSDDPEITAAPFFQHPLLNQSLIVKHRLRPHEFEMFDAPKPNATKIMLAIDRNDLKHGARYLFYGQRNFDEVARVTFGDSLKAGSRDRAILDLIDSLPSLDPFLLREHLKRAGYEPARAYFNLTDADIQKMHDFVRGEVMALVKLSYQQTTGAQTYASRLVVKLLSNAADDDLEPLKKVLKLSDQEFMDGIFSWRGFLYYKWVLTDLMPALSKVLVELEQTQPRGPRDPDSSAYLPGARARIQSAVTRACESVTGMLEVYDKAYGALTVDGQPAAFREFLIAAPDMFTRLGEELGAVQHIVSFWRFRFPPGKRALVTPDELMNIFLDFEDSTNFDHEHAAMVA